MKVICINAGWLNGNTRPNTLIEGRMYTSIGTLSIGNRIGYIIEELVESDIMMNVKLGHPPGARCISRFRPLDTDWIDEAIEKALNEEPELVNA